MAQITTFTPFANVDSLGVGSPQAANGHLILTAADGSIVGLVSSSSTGPRSPRAYRTTDTWTSLTVATTFASETGTGGAFMTGFTTSATTMFAGIWNDTATPDQAETWRSTDNGVTWTIGEVLNAGSNYFRAYCYIAMSNAQLFSGVGQANPNWWVDASGAGTASADQGNFAGEAANRMVMDAVEVGSTGTLIVATITRLNLLGLKTLNVYTSETYGTGTTTVRHTDATLTGSARVRLYHVPGGTTVLMTIYTGVLGTDAVWRSDDSGVTWSQISGTADAFGTFYKTSAGDICVGSTLNGFYVSDDDGASWTFITITGTPAASQLFSFVEAGSRLFAAGYSGLASAAVPYIWASNVFGGRRHRNSAWVDEMMVTA